MSFDQNHLAAPIVPLMLGNPVTDGSIPRLECLPLEFKASSPFRHVRSRLRADPDRQM